jgi:hypothetical protein
MRQSRTLPELESIAARLRCAADMDTSWTIDIFSFIERLASLFPGLKLVPVPDEKLPHAKAEANSATNTILVRESIVERAGWNSTSRFILVEEVCHIALGHVGPRYRRDARNQKIFSESEQRDEREARRLAALILAPTKFAKQCNSREELAEKFGLGKTASEIRWSEIQAVQRREEGKPRDLPPDVLDFLAEKRRLGFKITSIEED